MKKSKKTIWYGLFVVSLLCLVENIKAQTITTHFFGENAWMPDTIGNANACPDPPCVLYGKLHTEWENIKNSKASIIRFGGITPDRNRPTNYQYIKMIDSIRAKGMEPVIQVPFYKYRYTAAQAAAIVQYINITKGKNIKYWIIGNEPDLSYTYTTASQIAAYFKPFATAMKAADPRILTIGPECAWFNQTIIDGLTTPNGLDDITGTDVNGRYYCDIISFHMYGFNGTQNRAQVISKLTSPGSLQDNLIHLNTRINNCNVAHNRTGNFALKTAVTEANIDWQNNISDDLNGVGANSFIGGQFVAEMMAVGMKNKLDFINIWSVVEGNNNALNIGYIDAVTNIKKSMYYHFKLLAENFSGNYVSGITNQTNVKSFGSQSSLNTVVMIMNQELNTNFNYTVRLNMGLVTGTNLLKINVNSGIPVEYNDVITNQTSILLTFNSQGVLIKKCVYSLALQATFNLPPTCETIEMVLPLSLIAFNAYLNNNEVALKWTTESETNNAFFTVQKSIDGIIFEDVTTVKGAGNSNQRINYQTTDSKPSPGLSYYRLKQTDYSGNNIYSYLKSVEAGLNEFNFSVFPNPSDGTEINLKINSLFREPEIKGEILIGIFDDQGKQLYSQLKAIENKGERIITLYTSYKLTPGIYLITASFGQKMQKAKLIVK